MSTETERMSLSLQTSLRRYLERYPEAADNLQGIRQWWLTPALRMTSIEMLRDVLMVLVAQGEMEFSVLPDGTELYARSVSASVFSRKHQTDNDNH